MADFTFRHDADDRRYVASLGEQFAGEITYRLPRPGVIAIDHTGTEPEFRGQGLAARLTEFAIADIQDRGLKIVPNCPYTANFITERAELRELLA